MIVLLGDFIGLPNQVAVHSVSDRPYDALPFLKNLGGWGRCDFESHMWTASFLTFRVWHNMEMFAVPPSASGHLYALVLQCGADNECRCKLNVPSPSVLTLFSCHIVRETELCDVMFRVGVFNFGLFVLAPFLACARDGLASRWGIHARICGRGACAILFPFPSIMVRLVDDETFLKLFDNSSF